MRLERNQPDSISSSAAGVSSLLCAKKLSYFKVPKCYHCFFAQKGSPPPSYSLTYAAILIYCFNAFFSSPFVFVRGIKDPHYKTGTIQRYFPPSPTYLPTYLLDHEYVGHYLPLFGLFQLFYSIKKFHSNVAICPEFFMMIRNKSALRTID